MRDASRKIPEFSAIDASRILVVAGEARRASRATVRPLCFADSRDRISLDGKRAKPVIQIGGKTMLYVVALRPRFFLRSTAEKRVETILHELWHMAGEFDGTLHRERRHSVLPGQLFKDRFQPLVDRYLPQVPPSILDAMGYNGEVLMRQWLERPAPHFSLHPVKMGKPARRPVFTEAHLFYGPVKMVTLVEDP